MVFFYCKKRVFFCCCQCCRFHRQKYINAIYKSSLQITTVSAVAAAAVSSAFQLSYILNFSIVASNNVALVCAKRVDSMHRQC